MIRKGILFFCSIIVASSSLTACTSAQSSTKLGADVILLDISSGLNKAGTFNSEDHSTTSLSSRAVQLREKLSYSLGEGRAVYFGFVRETFGQQQIETLISPKLILTIETILNSDVKDKALRKDAKDGILAAWSTVIVSNPELANQANCKKTLEDKISVGSNGSITDRHASQLASSLCANALTANEQIEGLTSTPENIGSEIQAAVDRSIEKLASDQRRLVNADGKDVYLIPTIILVSDLIQVTNGSKITDTLFTLDSVDASCKLAQDESENYEIKIDQIVLISDGFASTEGNIKSDIRDKLSEYWKCWFETRGITDLDLGTRGINLGEI
jgi:hypothetical protein